MDEWMKEYEKQFRKRIKSHPREWKSVKQSNVSVVIECMRRDFKSGLFIARGKVMEATCRKLGVSFTRDAILKFISKK